ncbi:hypothetical protein NKH77_06910 [Streptomyces sp. M19]
MSAVEPGPGRGARPRRPSLARLLHQGLIVTVNSDDPPFFGGYVNDNYRAAAAALDLTAEDIVALARNSVHASFADDQTKARMLDRIQVAADAIAPPAFGRPRRAPTEHCGSRDLTDPPPVVGPSPTARPEGVPAGTRVVRESGA